MAVWKDSKWNFHLVENFLEKSGWSFLRLRQTEDFFEIWVAPEKSASMMVIINSFRGKYLMIYVIDGTGYEKAVTRIVEVVDSCLEFPKPSVQLYYPRLEMKAKNIFGLEENRMIELMIYGWGDAGNCISQWQLVEQSIRFIPKKG